MVATNEVEPTQFLNEVSSVNVNRLDRKQIDEDFVTTTPTSRKQPSDVEKFFQVVCFWC